MTETNAAGFAFVFGCSRRVEASGYVGAFGRAMNKIYEVDEAGHSGSCARSTWPSPS